MAARLRPADGQPSAAGAPVVVGLALAVALLALWLVNPFAALLLTPTLHLWMLATLVDPPPPRRARLVLVAVGLLAPALLVLYELIALSLDPRQRRLVPAAAGGRRPHGDRAGADRGACWRRSLGATVADRPQAHAPGPIRVAPAERPSVRGPASYAGPGSLGGTESALDPR